MNPSKVYYADFRANYKVSAHHCRKLLGEKCEEYHAAGKLTEGQYRRYKEIYRKYTKLMKDYHH